MSAIDAVASFHGGYELCRGNAPFLVLRQFGRHVGAHANALEAIGGLDMGYVGAALSCFMCFCHGSPKFAGLFRSRYTARRFKIELKATDTLQATGCQNKLTQPCASDFSDQGHGHLFWLTSLPTNS